MSDIVVYDNPDTGFAALVFPAEGWTAEEVLLKDVPLPEQPTAVIIDSSILPPDEIFRNAWLRSGSTVVVDLPLAKPIWKNIFRVVFRFYLAQLIIDNSPVQLDAIIDNIGDADVLVDAAVNVAAILAIWPVDLPVAPAGWIN